MCGIAGIYAYGLGSAPAERAELLAMRESMQRRGPDGEGLWIAPHGRAGLAHRRLSIIDLSKAGAQPMSTPDGRLWIIFNGEIYNFRELRAELEKRGHRFRSTSDTEVLLGLYLEHGADMVRHLRGMFAFGIWDEQQRTLFLARDPFGIKPLYYSDAHGTFRFASQVKALVAGGRVDTSPDPAGHAGFFLWGAVPEPYTTYRAIRALPAGCTLLVPEKGVRAPLRYFSVREEIQRAESDGQRMAAGEIQALVSGELQDSVKHHLVSDVPVGLFLSAGIDSSALAAITSGLLPGRLHAVTLGFREYVGSGRDETVWASKTAAAYGAQHDVRWIEKSEFDEQLTPILAAMDQPSTDGVNTYLVSRSAAQSGLKVALSGLGGDELFGGYPSFRDVPRLERLPALGRRFPHAARWLRLAASAAIPRWISPKYAGVFEFAGSTGGAYLLRRGLYMPWELERVMEREMAARGIEELATLDRLEEDVRGIRSPRLRVAALEIGWYMRNQLLRDADWAGMAHSLEIRVPMVDVDFFRALLPALAAADAPVKATLARTPRKALPEDIVERAKSGFAVPVANWIRGGTGGRERGLRGWARRVNHAPGVGYRVLALVSDAYGGIGGIACFNRNFLAAMSSHDAIREILVIPRLAPLPVESTPFKVRIASNAVGGKFSYFGTLLRLLLNGPNFDLTFCGHINLVPAGYIAARMCRTPSIGILHGIEAWSPNNVFSRLFIRRIDWYAAVSKLTRERFCSWSGISSVHVGHIPNTVVLEEFGPGPKDAALVSRYALSGKRVLLKIGRLAAEERYKGFDQVLDILPKLLQRHPDLVYLIVGDGTDRARLEDLVKHRHLENHVRFAGYIPDSEKAAHYRLADAYVMPSKGEGFGIVLLEALACGIPVVASKVDGSIEAVLNGRIGILVDPDIAEDVIHGVEQALGTSAREVPNALRELAFPSFESKCHRFLDRWLYGKFTIESNEINPESHGTAVGAQGGSPR